MKPFARMILVSFLALVGVVTTYIILKRRRKRRDAECEVKTCPQDVQPLCDDVAKNVSPRRFKWLNLCDNHYCALVKSLEKQLARRPNVWGAGLWPNAETEDIARKCTGLIKPYGGMLNDFLIPGDPLVVSKYRRWGPMRETDAECRHSGAAGAFRCLYRLCHDCAMVRRPPRRKRGTEKHQPKGAGPMNPLA